MNRALSFRSRIRKSMTGAAAVVMISSLALTGLSSSAGASVSRIQIQTYEYTAINFYVGTALGSTQSVFVTVNPCTGNFSGTGIVPGYGASTVSGNSNGGSATIYLNYTVGTQTNYQVTALVTFNSDGSFSGTWSDNYSPVAQSGTVTSNAPNVTDVTTWANHGQYVAANGGGNDAAHSCLGMPIAGNK